LNNGTNGPDTNGPDSHGPDSDFGDDNSRRGTLDRIAWTLATWFGSGLAPVAPGTAGSLGAIPLYVIVIRFGRPGVAIAALLVTAIGVWAATLVSRRLAKKDPQVVVIDEVAGMLVTMLPYDVFSLRGLILGFVLFRILDALKPWPIRQFENYPGGWGIVLDDLAAGAIAATALGVFRETGFFG
jgi:phosphatidylglycerophosphatase A